MYSGVLFKNVTIPASGTSSYDSSEMFYVPGLTSDHVLINDSLPQEIPEGATWTTESPSEGTYGYGVFRLSFPNPVHFDNAVPMNLAFGIPST